MSDVTPSENAGTYRGRTLEEVLPPPVAPGLRTGRLLGRGGSSAVWLVTDDGGQRFALKVAVADRSGRAPSDPPVAGDPVRHGRRAVQASNGPPSGAPLSAAAEGASSRGNEEARPAPEQDIGVHDAAHELRLLQRLPHEHLLRVHRVVDTDQGPGLLMDLAPGGSLLHLVTSRGPLPIPEVVTALVPVAQVLSHLHAAGVLHGDVTPGNILFTSEGKPLLGDFGAGRLLGSDRGTAAGTPGFVDPTSDGSFDSGVDVFALAAVSWFALTGRVPGPTEQRPPLALMVPEVPPQLMQLVEDGLSQDRDRRPAADHFARILLASASPDPVNLVPAVHPSVLPELVTKRTSIRPAVPPSRWKRITRGSRRDRRDGRDVVRRPTSPAGESPDRRTPVHTSRGRRSGPSMEQRSRTGLAIAAGLAALLLLVVGVALTLTGVRVPDAAPSGSAPGAAPDQEPAPSAGDRTPADGGSADPGGPEGAADQGGREGAGAPMEPPADAPPTGDPVTALSRLAALRATAFETADEAVLATVDVDGSPAMTADQEAVAALAGTGRRLRDLSIGVRDPVVLDDADVAAMPALGGLPGVAEPPAGTQVSLVRATATISSYTEGAEQAHLDAEPALPGTEPGQLMAAARQELIFVLWKSDAGWQIHSVVSPPG